MNNQYPLLYEFAKFSKQGIATERYLALTKKGKKIFRNELALLSKKAATPLEEYNKERVLFFIIMRFYEEFVVISKLTIKDRILNTVTLGLWGRWQGRQLVQPYVGRK